MNATRTVYELLATRNWYMTNAPRANPQGRLDMPYILRDNHGRIVARAGSRDEMEQVASRKVQS